MKDNGIGVIGGMGPYAGLDLVRKIFDQTVANKDHDHLPVALLSYPGHIPDRSPFLFGDTDLNPAHAMVDLAERLEAAGCSVAAVPCNTAHTPPIFDVLRDELAARGAGIRILHMIEETVGFVREHYPDLRRLGVLSTTAIYRFEVYKRTLEAAGYEVVRLDAEGQEELVNATIFDHEWGLKAHSNPPTEEARARLLRAVERMKRGGAEAIILGCTELPLVLDGPTAHGLPLIDPTVATARALIAATFPDRLRALEPAAREAA